MKYNYSKILLACVLLLATGCKIKKAVIEPAQPQPKIVQQADTTQIPAFPAEVLYVLAREYESIHDSTKAKFDMPQSEVIRHDSMPLEQYMEQRLIQLYPEKAYKGLLRKTNTIAQKAIPPKRKKQIVLPELEMPTSTGTQQENRFHTFVSDSDEVAFMNMTAPEEKLYRELNSLADDSSFVTLEQMKNITIRDSAWNLDKRLVSDTLPFFLQERWTVSLLLSGIGTHVFYRIMQSKARAEYVSEYYYPGQTSDGMRGDAFKHLFVNTMLKRYTTEALAWLVMDIYWENIRTNAPCDMVMDLHNNHVGRSTQYRTFRGDFWKDRYNWLGWSDNILQFVEDTTNNATYHQWNKQLPLFFIRQEEEQADKSLYLYWNKSKIKQQP